ncbi:glycosyltransferase family 4 protein [Chryseobacterium profundimaris]|uniref:Glycosyltransferase involved in cell wall bisynthesis n=1 Tax=Chryseobacterium profundimaris TaxID=1387275 RepID=A0ABY1NPP4_9FLAO|nr:glycosyltransferase family 4 protein [Chryseobacterium profundimaris]SMP14796.1 Glycosyltransferase involved in cell wall bisynthesis [Chryseobacterium profundimaris]
MDIVHLILGKANPEKMNGVNKVVFNIASKQALIKMNVEVWGISENTEINYPERIFTTKIFQRRKNPFSIPEGLKKEILKSTHDTIFHLHGGWIPVFSSLSMFLKKNNRRYVITPHGSYNEIAMKKSRFIKKLYFKWFEKKVIRNAGKIHCIGESEIGGLHTLQRTDKMVLIHYGFEKIQSDSKTISAQKQMIFGFVGRLDVHTKGLDILIDSFAPFSKQYPESKLWIIGDSMEKEKFHQKIKQNSLEDKVELMGSKFGDEKNDLIMKMDVFLHPSRNEGLPVAVIEAAAFGKPCIVTRNTNVGHLIEQYNAGICLAFPDAELLTDALVKIYNIRQKNNLEYQKMGKNALKMVEEAFDWNNVLSEMNNKLYTF